MSRLEKSDRYIISDCHLGHVGISHFRKVKHLLTGEPYTSEEQHEALYETLCQVPKRATLFMLGDIAFTPEWLLRIKELPCRNKILVCGNHDLDRGTVSMRDIVNCYEKVYALHKYKKHWMSHAPMHSDELRGKRSMHGHTHYYLMVDSGGVPDKNYVNVCCEYTGHRPITWEYAISEEYQQECGRKYYEYMADNEIIPNS